MSDHARRRNFLLPQLGIRLSPCGSTPLGGSLRSDVKSDRLEDATPGGSPKPTRSAVLDRGAIGVLRTTNLSLEHGQRGILGSAGQKKIQVQTRIIWTWTYLPSKKCGIMDPHLRMRNGPCRVRRKSISKHVPHATGDRATTDMTDGRSEALGFVSATRGRRNFGSDT